MPLIQEALRSERKELRDAGMNALAIEAERLITAEVNEFEYNKAQCLETLTMLSGFTRSVPSIAHKKTVEGAREKPEVHEPPYEPDLRLVYNKFLDWWIERGLMTEEEFLRNVPNILTSRSAGGRGTAKKIPVEIPLKKSSRPGSEDVLFMNLTDKRGVFMANPAYGLDVDLARKGYTEDNPGRIGSRQVTGGRNTRGIFMLDLTTHIAQSDLALAELDYQMDKSIKRVADRSRWTGPVTPLTFVIGSESGNPFADHVELLLASSDPDTYMIADDYDAYDTTQRNSNMRRIIRDVIAKRLVEAGYANEPFLG
jgi:hypothetical protein